MELLIRGKTSLKSVVGTESNRQIIGLDDLTSEVNSGRSIEEKWSKYKSAATGGSMVSGLDNVSVLFMGRWWWIFFPDGYNFICKEVHEIIASQS